jgi:hypothetical protein
VTTDARTDGTTFADAVADGRADAEPNASDGVSVLYMKDTSNTTGELHVLDLKLGQ